MTDHLDIAAAIVRDAIDPHGGEIVVNVGGSANVVGTLAPALGVIVADAGPIGIVLDAVAPNPGRVFIPWHAITHVRPTRPGDAPYALPADQQTDVTLDGGPGVKGEGPFR